MKWTVRKSQWRHRGREDQRPHQQGSTPAGPEQGGQTRTNKRRQVWATGPWWPCKSTVTKQVQVMSARQGSAREGSKEEEYPWRSTGRVKAEGCRGCWGIQDPDAKAKLTLEWTKSVFRFPSDIWKSGGQEGEKGNYLRWHSIFHFLGWIFIKKPRNVSACATPLLHQRSDGAACVWCVSSNFRLLLLLYRI